MLLWLWLLLCELRSRACTELKQAMVRTEEDLALWREGSYKRDGYRFGNELKNTATTQ